MASQGQIEAHEVITSLRARSGRDRIAYAVSTFEKFHASSFLEYATVHKALFFEALLQKDMIESFADDEGYRDLVVRAIETTLAGDAYSFEYAFERSLDNIFEAADEKDGAGLTDLMKRISVVVKPLIIRLFAEEETGKAWRCYLLPVQTRDLQFRFNYEGRAPYKVETITPTRLAYYATLWEAIVSGDSSRIPQTLGRTALGNLICYAEFMTYARSRSKVLSSFMISTMFEHFAVHSQFGLKAAAKEMHYLEVLSRPPEEQ